MHLFQQFKAGHIRKSQVEHHAIERACRITLQCLAASSCGHNLDIVVTKQLDDGCAFDVVVLDNQQSLGAWSCEIFDPVERRHKSFGCRLLYQIGKGAMR